MEGFQTIVDFLIHFISNYLSPEKLTQKKPSNFSKFQFLNDKIDQNINFAKIAQCQMALFV